MKTFNQRYEEKSPLLYVPSSYTFRAITVIGEYLDDLSTEIENIKQLMGKE